MLITFCELLVEILSAEHAKAYIHIHERLARSLESPLKALCRAVVFPIPILQTNVRFLYPHSVRLFNQDCLFHCDFYA